MNLTANGLPHSVLGADGVTLEWLIADQRSAQHPGTLALHTLLLREHNRRVAEFTPEYLQQLEAQYGCQPKPCTQVLALHLNKFKVHMYICKYAAAHSLLKSLTNNSSSLCYLSVASESVVHHGVLCEQRCDTCADIHATAAMP
jgi:hypothetical protein